MNPVITFEINFSDKKIIVKSQFPADVTEVWKAFTDPEILGKWFAPKPFLLVTKEMNFKPGGYWLYGMISPQGEEYWGKTEYESIDPERSYEARDAFCDSKGNINKDLPGMKWINNFSEDKGITTVINTICFENEEHIKQIIEMGFEEGYKMGLQQLQEIL